VVDGSVVAAQTDGGPLVSMHWRGRTVVFEVVEKTCMVGKLHHLLWNCNIDTQILASRTGDVGEWSVAIVIALV
jgi:hypothetical protein